MFSENQTEALNTVIKEYNKKLCEVLPSDSEVEDVTFSDRFERKMNRLLFHQKHFYYKLINTAAKRVACFIIALLTIMSITTFSVKAFRDPLVKFLVYTFKEGSTLTFNANSEAAPGKFEAKRPNYIPPQFTNTLTNVTKIDSVIVWLKDAEENDFMFRQIYKTNSPQSITVNTENARTKIVTIKGKYKGFLCDNKDFLWLGFETDSDIFYIDLASKYTEAEIIKIAESIDC